MAGQYGNQGICTGENTDQSVISIRHLRKEYPDVTPLADVSAEVKKGEVISVIGPSGTEIGRAHV